MEDKRLILSSNKPAEATNLAYQIAREKLAQTDNIAELCRKAGVECTGAGGLKSIVVEFLNRPYTVSLPDADVLTAKGTNALSIREKLVILHYLLTAKGTPPVKKLISFQELPEGVIYYPTFLKRSVQPLVSRFGSVPDLLLTAAEGLGGRQAEVGDVSVKINAFPRVPLTLAVWRGDEEFEARGNILFDAGIPDYLPTEDITVLCETICWKIIKSVTGK